MALENVSERDLIAFQVNVIRGLAKRSRKSLLTTCSALMVLLRVENGDPVNAAAGKRIGEAAWDTEAEVIALLAEFGAFDDLPN